MRSKAKTTLLAAAVLWMVGAVVWPGCAVVPFFPTYKPIAHWKKQDVDLTKSGPVTRTDLLARIGKPDVEFSDLNVACYFLDEVHRRELVLMFFVLPIPITSANETEVVFVQFDESNRVQRLAIGTTYQMNTWDGLRNDARKWLTEEKRP